MTSVQGAKRRREEDETGESENGPSTTKRTRLPEPHNLTTTSCAQRSERDRLSPLSDELLIRILHLLPIEGVLLARTLSSRWAKLASDNQVWKSLYHKRFVLPRVLRIPKSGVEGELSGRWGFSGRSSRWLGEERLLDAGGNEGKPRTDWMARYRLRHNWSKGKARMKKVVMDGGDSGERYDLTEDEAVADKRLMVRLVSGNVITVDKTFGLRVWDVKSKSHGMSSPLASLDLHGASPSSISVELDATKTTTSVVVGFEDGTFGIWNLDHGEDSVGFEGVYRRPATPRSDRRTALSAVALSMPYLLTISDAQQLSLYTFKPTQHDTDDEKAALQPRLLVSLKSHTTWPPLSLSIRPTPSTIIASIAYSVPTYLSGWSVGLQELHLDPNSGNIIQSRLATAIEAGFHSLLSTPSSGTCTPDLHAPQSTDGRGTGPNQGVGARPSSLSYSHPYLLAGHKDNTLSLYLVQSSPTELRVGKGAKLWGHTSEVSGATIGGTGRAVSVGGGSGEVRVWELEGGRRNKEGSVKVWGDVVSPDDGGAGAGGEGTTEQRRGWIGFDDEVVVVMNEGEEGGARSSTLMVYDFT